MPYTSFRRGYSKTSFPRSRSSYKRSDTKYMPQQFQATFAVDQGQQYSNVVAANESSNGVVKISKISGCIAVPRDIEAAMWAIVYNPSGMQIGNLDWNDLDNHKFNKMYQGPSNYVLASGMVITALNNRFSCALSKNLNVGDKIYLLIRTQTLANAAPGTMLI